MKRVLTRIGVFKTSLVVAIVYAFMSLLYTVIGVGMIAFGSDAMKIMGFMYAFMPILMLVLGFLGTALMCWLYNVVAGWVGGIEVTVEDR